MNILTKPNVHCRLGTIAFVLPVLLTAASCMPPPVKAVDVFLEGYADADVEEMVAVTDGPDRDLLRRALAEQATNPSGRLALSLPPKPIEHEIIEVERDGADRKVVLTRIKMKNPLAYSSKRVGQLMEDIPKTREQRRRFLVVRSGDFWGVKLDMKAILARSVFAEKVLDQIRSGQLADAERALDGVPPPPDDPNAQRKKDRLIDTLTRELNVAKARTTTTATTAAKR